VTAVTNCSGTAIPWVKDYLHHPMSSTDSQRLIEVLKATLLHVETSNEWSQEDQAVIELRNILKRRIDLELSALPDQEGV
jgi:hypothetical protein